MRALEQEISADQDPKARILLGLWIFSVLSLVLIALGSDKDGSVSITNMAHKFYPPKHPPPPPPPPPPQEPPSPPTSSKADHEKSSEDPELEEALAIVSAKHKTVIIAFVDKAYTEGDTPMLDIFLDGFWIGEDTRKLIKHLLIVAVDQTAYDRCTLLQLHCYKLKTEGVEYDGAKKPFMSDDFMKMMWRRILFLGDVLKHGYNFIFTDMDVLWLGNPFPLLKDEHLDLQVSVDYFNGNPWSEDNPINTGFYMMRSNNKTIALYDKWYGEKDNSTRMKEQHYLYNLMRGGEFEKLGIRVRFLDTRFFSGFCENSKDVKKVSTVHANCCLSIRAKEAELIRVLDDWQRFKASNDEDKSEFQWSDHKACRNS
ncbi:hypothetical protein LXL04_012104 [Taraxacum kok-saghyz]